jgi:spore coat protein B
MVKYHILFFAYFLPNPRKKGGFISTTSPRDTYRCSVNVYLNKRRKLWVMNKEVMNLHVGKTIRVDRGGPESRQGKLLAVFDDYFVLLTEKDGVVYYKTNHIKSVTESSKDLMKLGLEIPKNFDYKTGDNFHKLLESIKYQWVRINRGNTEALEGVLNDVNKDFASLIVKEEVVRFSMKHIRNISYGLMVETQKNDSDDSDNNQNNDNTEDNDQNSEDNNDDKE